MTEVFVQNKIPGITLYETEAGRGKTFLALIDDDIVDKLNYIKTKDAVGNESTMVPVVKNGTVGQNTIRLEYPISTPIRKIMADLVVLGGKFADFSIMDNNDSKGGLDIPRYSLTIYLNSRYNKYQF